MPAVREIGRCDKCRARLRVGYGTRKENYKTAAASKRWRWDDSNPDYVSVVCPKCIAAEKQAEQGELRL